MVANNQVSTAQQSNAIAQAQKDLGVPQVKHFPKKTPVLSYKIGEFSSILGIKQVFDERTGSYDEGTPYYSFMIKTQINEPGADQGVKRDVYALGGFRPSPEIFQELADHFAKLAKETVGLPLGAPDDDEEDLASKLALLRKFKVETK